MKKWIRSWLGIDEVKYQIVNSCNDIDEQIRDLAQEFGSLRRQVSSSLTAQARLIAKLDPRFAQSEFDPERKAESDKLGDAVVKRLKAEDWARRHTEGKPDDPPK